MLTGANNESTNCGDSVCGKASPVHHVMASTGTRPPARNGYTILITDTGQTMVKDCGDWITCPPKRGLMATDGVDIYINTGKIWRPYSDFVKAYVNCLDFSEFPGFCEAVNNCIEEENSVTLVDCSGNPLTSSTPVATCDFVTGAISTALAQTIPSGTQLPNTGPADGTLPLFVVLGSPNTIYYWTGQQWIPTGDGVGGTGGGGGGTTTTTVSTNDSINGDGSGANPLGVNWDAMNGNLSAATINYLCSRLSDLGCNLGGGTGGGGIPTYVGPTVNDAPVFTISNNVVAVDCARLIALINQCPDAYVCSPAWFMTCEPLRVYGCIGETILPIGPTTVPKTIGPNGYAEWGGNEFNENFGGIVPIRQGNSSGKIITYIPWTNCFEAGGGGGDGESEG